MLKLLTMITMIVHTCFADIDLCNLSTHDTGLDFSDFDILTGKEYAKISNNNHSFNVT